jgi:peptidoglycan/xylan/chitin deacetylase (PgdA/CDA1 family)
MSRYSASPEREPGSAWIGRQVLKRLAPAGAKARLSLLAFHRVLREPDLLRPGEPNAEEFEQRLRWIKGWFNVLPLPEAITRLKDGRLPERPLAITFDDGYADNHDVALPILRKLGLPATFFVTTGYLDGGRMFNDTVIEAVRQSRDSALDLQDLGMGVHRLSTPEQRRAAIAAILPRVKYLPVGRREAVADAIAERAGARLPEDLMMTSAQVAALHSAGMDIGGHTVTHPILAGLPLEGARAEIVDGCARLEEITGAPVRIFAYPNGQPGRDYHPEHPVLLRELGFDGAVSAVWGAARAGTDPFQIPRFTPWDRRPLPFALRMAQNLVRSEHVGA